MGRTIMLKMYGGSAWQRKHGIGMARWYASQYIPVGISANISLHVRSKRIDNAYVGDCDVARNGTDTTPWLIRITVVAGVGCSKYQFLSRLAHELVHSKQFVTNEFAKTPNGVRFRRKFLSDTYIDDNYRDTPWEIEAVGSEYSVVSKYCINADIENDVFKYSLLRRMP